MTDATGLRDRYAVVGIGLSRFGKVPGTSAMGFCLESAKRAIEDCGIARDEIDGVLVLMPPQMGEQHGWASRVAAFLGITPAFCARSATAAKHSCARAAAAARVSPASTRRWCGEPCTR